MLKLISKYQECENALGATKLQVFRKCFPIESKSLYEEPFNISLERWISEGAEQILRKK